jgi:20S proteasome subunit beta 4
MNFQQGYELMKKCVAEISKRLVVNLPTFAVRMVDKDGIHEIEPIEARKLVI